MNVEVGQTWVGKDGFFTVVILDVDKNYVVFKPTKIQGEPIPAWDSDPVKLNVKTFLQRFKQ